MTAQHQAHTFRAGDRWFIAGTLNLPGLSTIAGAKFEWALMDEDENAVLFTPNVNIAIVDPEIKTVLITVLEVITRTVQPKRYTDVFRVTPVGQGPITVWEGPIHVKATPFVNEGASFVLMTEMASAEDQSSAVVTPP